MQGMAAYDQAWAPSTSMELHGGRGEGDQGTVSAGRRACMQGWLGGLPACTHTLLRLGMRRHGPFQDDKHGVPTHRRK